MSVTDLRNAFSTFPHQIWVLSEFGKPIFSSCGSESDLAATFAVIQVLVRTFESWKDTLLCIQMKGLHIQFSYRSPLILCVVSKAPANLSLQLDMIYNQVISILSKSVLKKTFVEKGDNFDLRRWLSDLDKRVDVCLNSFVEDPVVYLTGFRILPLNPSDREFLVSTMGSCIVEATDSVAFAVLIAHRQLVSMVRMKRLDLKASDFNILANLVECHSSLRDGETWVPICLPHFNQNACWAFISYLWEDNGPCLIMLSTDKNSFFTLRDVKLKILDKLDVYKRKNELKTSISIPEQMLRTQRPNPELWHFMYKNILSSQVCCSSPAKPFIALDEQKELYKGYFEVTDAMRKSKIGRILFVQKDEYTIFAWITGSFELYAAFSPLVSQVSVMETAERLLRILRKEEKRVFFNINPGVLNGP
ncbi:unnamed protein product [Bursaphelenchus xylophilus]|uniref:Vacuolar fusion protein MON1 homolog n=1 Tax=Bursaphelenchus xylophilus TaxID=6326 RepID=A0A1I7RHS6_BURXY|nr:unnamed protein product [Bursaphelenchus xylophilus]CAG9115436.1 unnamed protein product [Bursaphelenchus xylophilus]